MCAGLRPQPSSYWPQFGVAVVFEAELETRLPASGLLAASRSAGVSMPWATALRISWMAMLSRSGCCSSCCGLAQFVENDPDSDLFAQVFGHGLGRS